MKELQEIIERFKRAEESCQEQMARTDVPALVLTFASIAATYKTVIEMLEDFMSKHSVFCVNVHHPSFKAAKGYQALLDSLEKERNN